MSFSREKGEFDRFFNRLDLLVEESRPDRQPDRPVDPTGFHLCHGHVVASLDTVLDDDHLYVLGGFKQTANLRWKSQTSIGKH